jgi:hypothetical protein
LDYARQHIFPIALSDEEKLKAPLEELLIKRKSFFSRNEIFEIIDTRRLFYTSSNDACEMETPCTLNFMLFLPISRYPKKSVKLKKIHTVPYEKKTIFGRQWQKFKAPATLVVADKNLLYDYQSFDCLQSLLGHDIFPCELCLQKRKQDLDPCLETMVFDTRNVKRLQEICEVEKSQKTAEIAINLGNEGILYSDATPGKMFEICSSENITNKLPKSGRVTFDTSCIQNFDENILDQDNDASSDMESVHEGDADDDSVDIHSVRFNPNNPFFIQSRHESTRIGENIQPNWRQDDSTISLINEHVHENSWAYILTLLLLFLGSVTSAFIYAYFQRRSQHIVRIQTRHRRDSSASDVGQALVRFVNRSTPIV